MNSEKSTNGKPPEVRGKDVLTTKQRLIWSSVGTVASVVNYNLVGILIFGSLLLHAIVKLILEVERREK
jgi:hypothetical protein